MILTNTSCQIHKEDKIDVKNLIVVKNRGRIKGDWNYWAQSGPIFKRAQRCHQNKHFFLNY